MPGRPSGRGRFGRGGCPAGLDERGDDHGQVGDPRHHLKHRHPRGQLRDPGHDRHPPRVRVHVRGQIERDPALAGQQSRVLQVTQTVGQHAGRDDDERDRGPVKEHSRHSAGRLAGTAASTAPPRRPARARRPASGATVDPDARTAVHRNSVVSRPSRPTARKAVTVSAPAPMATARCTSPRSWADRLAAVRRIQNTMPVTRPTASTLSSPPTACLRPAGQHAGREGQHRRKAAGDHHRTQHAEPHRGGRYPAVSAWRRDLAQCGQQNADHESRLEPLAQPDQQVRNQHQPTSRQLR